MSGRKGWKDKRSGDSGDYSGNGGGGSTYDSLRDRYRSPGRNADSPWSGAKSGGDSRPTTPGAVRGVSMPAPPAQLTDGTVGGADQGGDQGKVYMGKSLGVLKADHRTRSTAPIVVGVAQDMTVSMSDWPRYMIRHGAGMVEDVGKYAGSADVEFLFMGFGDGPRRDSHPIQVAPKFGRGIELADHLASLKEQAGGANGVESSNLAVQYMLRMCSTDDATKAWFFIVTDEGTYGETSSSEVQRHFGTPPGELPLSTKDALQLLSLRMEIFVLLCGNTGSWRGPGSWGEGYDGEKIKKQWADLLGPERVIPIEYKYKIADTIIGVVATCTGKGEEFDQALVACHRGTQWGTVNVQSVRQSLSFVRSSRGQQIAKVSRGRKSILTVGGDE